MKKNPSPISHVSLLSCDERTVRQLSKVIFRMGLHCQVFDDKCNLQQSDLIIIDINQYYHQDKVTQSWHSSIPVVGLLTHGSPSEIEKSLDLGITTVVHKPINQNGLFSAFVIAQWTKYKNSTLTAELDDLRNRHHLRDQVIKATILLMDRYEISVEQAIAMLRKLSMKNNKSLEKISLDLVIQLSDPVKIQR